jgi:parvulin-like peptidyl-prolyl isomerase
LTRIFRRSLVAAVALLAVLALSGCGNDRPGAAALVGKNRITTDQLNGLVTRALADPTAKQKLGSDQAGFQRQELAQLINRQVLAAAARTEKITVTDGDIDQRLSLFASQLGGQQQLMQSAAQNGIAAKDLRPYVRDLVLKDAIGDALTKDEQVDQATLQSVYTQNIGQYDQVHAAHIVVADQALAQQILDQVKADPSKFAALAKQYSLDTSNKDSGGDLAPAGRGQFVKEFEDAVFGAPAGSYLLVHTQFGWHVVHVIERRTTTLAQATPDLRRIALKDVRDQRTGALLTTTAKKLGVTVNPRFGVYQADSGTVVGKDSGLSSPAPSPGGSAGSDSPAPASAAPSPVAS